MFSILKFLSTFFTKQCLIPWVIVLYLDVPPNSGNLEVHNPLFYHWEGTKRIGGSNTWTKVPVKTGDVIIFPGWLLHRTEKSATDTPRITINTNITTSSTPIHRDRITPSLGEYISWQMIQTVLYYY